MAIYYYTRVIILRNKWACPFIRGRGRVLSSELWTSRCDVLRWSEGVVSGVVNAMLASRVNRETLLYFLIIVQLIPILFWLGRSSRIFSTVKKGMYSVNWNITVASRLANGGFSDARVNSYPLRSYIANVFPRSFAKIHRSLTCIATFPLFQFRQCWYNYINEVTLYHCTLSVYTFPSFPSVYHAGIY